MPLLEHRQSERGHFTIEQAGIAEQAFEAIEAYVSVFLEDQTGGRTAEFEIPVWFANTRRILIGFQGLLDRAVFHLEMTNRTGYLDL